MKLQWIDPPSGWKYGFPKIWDSEAQPNVHKFLCDNGYPHELIEDFGSHFYTRHWAVTEEDIAKYYSNNL